MPYVTRTADSNPVHTARSLDSACPGKPHILAFAPNAWDGPWMNRQHILSRLALRGWSVTYSTGPLAMWQRGSARWRAAPWFSTCETRDGVQVEYPGKAFPRWARVAPYDRLVTRRHAAALLEQARCNPEHAIAYVFHPSLYDVAAAARCRWTVYHAYDIFAQQPEWTDELARAERTLLREADLVVASSPTVANTLQSAGREDVLVVPNGGDAAAFEAGARLPCPPDLAHIPRPRIAYIGVVNRKVDFPMIATVAKQRPDWHWVLVGPVPAGGSAAPASDAKIAAGFRACQSLPNVHFLGGKPHTDLPAYVAHMDVNTMCYRADRGWWNAAAPLKLHEYLATGRPVVSTDLSDIRSFSDVVTFVRGANGWAHGIETALQDRSQQAAEQRRRVARANSWDRRVDLLERDLEGMIQPADMRSEERPSTMRRSAAG